MDKNKPQFPKFTSPFQSYYSAGDESECLCPSCECLLDYYEWEDKQFRYCPECGQKLMNRDEYEEEKSIKKESIDLFINSNGIIDADRYSKLIQRGIEQYERLSKV